MLCANTNENDKEIAAFEKLRNKIKDLPDDVQNDYPTLQHFLATNNCKASAAEKMLRNYVKWRDDFKPDKIQKDDFKDELQGGTMFLHGADIRSKPCIVIFPARHNPQSRSLQQTTKMAVYWLQKAIRKMKPGVEQFVILIDLQHCTRRNIDFEFFKELDGFLHFYSGRIANIYVIRKNWLWNSLISPVIKTLADKRTLQKITVMGQDFKEQLRKVFSEDNLLKEHGGTSVYKFDSQSLAESSDILSILKERKLMVTAENDTEVQKKLLGEVLKDMADADIPKKYKEKFRKAIASLPDASDSKHKKAGAEDTAILRHQAELIQLDVAQLALRKQVLEETIRQAEKARKELPLLQEHLKNKHAELAEIVAEIASAEDSENRLSIVKDSKTREIVLDKINKLSVETPYGELVASINGPDELCTMQEFYDYVCAKSESLYPKGAGDPVADRYHLFLYEDCCVVAVADGCGWGKKAKEAAVKSTDIFVSFMSDFKSEISDTLHASRLMLRAFSTAHNAIVEGAENYGTVGTTALLGGIALQLEDGKWVFVCASVGDCKAFKVSVKTGKIAEITYGNRQNVSDCKDPGGRLGPQHMNGNPDLRNLGVYQVTCNEGDLIIILSDGVHDNLDPQYNGKNPHDLGLTASSNSWDAVSDLEKATEVKNDWTIKLLNSLIGDRIKDATPKYITQSLVEHSVKMTQTVREFMEKNPHKKQPEDYTLYPGKMDHSTCCCFRIGKYMEPSKNDKDKPNSLVDSGESNGQNINCDLYANK